MSKNSIYFDVQDSLSADEINEYDIEKVQYVRWKDSNSSNYNTHIIRHDLEALANNTTYTSFSSGFYFLPQILEITDGGADINDAKNEFAVCLKNSVLTTLNQVLVKLNDVQLTDNSQFACMYENWELLHLSQNDLKNMKDLINFSPDSSTSTYATADSIFAPKDYEYNNNIKQELFDPAEGYHASSLKAVNTGMIDRMLMTSFKPSDASVTTYYISGTSAEIQKSHVVAGVNTLTYYIYTYIPLGFIHPIFKKLPVMRGMKLNLQVGVNNDYQVELTRVVDKITKSEVKNSSIGNNICPFQVSAIGRGHDLPDGAKIKLTINSTEQVHIILPQITFTPDFEAKYNSDPVKKISYKDYMVYSPNSLNNLGENATVNSESIVNSVVRPRELIIIPQNETSLKNPFSSSPLTTATYAKIKNFNVQINGQNIWQQSHNYDYESYLEMIGAVAIDGRQFKHFGVSNGLISKQDWDKNYTYYYVNLNNAKNSPDDRLGKQISVSFQSVSKKTLRYFCIVTRERQLLVNVSIGKVKEVTMEDDSTEVPSDFE
jgi:hypothetical protein